MKKLGAMLILFSCLLYCLRFIKGQRARLRELESLALLLESMGTELGQRLTPLPELIGLMEGRAGGSAEAFVARLQASLPRLGDESFADIWRGSASDSFRLLNEQELNSVAELGVYLGRFDIAAQLRAIDDCARLLRDLALLLRREQRDKRRVRLGLACAGGAMLVIVLI